MQLLRSLPCNLGVKVDVNKSECIELEEWITQKIKDFQASHGDALIVRNGFLEFESDGVFRVLDDGFAASTTDMRTGQLSRKRNPRRVASL